MANAVDISTEIVAFLTENRPKRAEDLAELAASYNALCEAANLRLRRCADYLRRGLLSEAIAYAEVAPDLLDLVTALDIPQIERWNSTCREQNLELAPVLLLDIAQELNEAYVSIGPMQDLLKQLRLLSLAVAPVERRLQVLHSLAQIDPNNSTWDADIQEFERVRLGEIASDALAAAKAEDLDELSKLHSEMTQDAWRTPVPKKLVRGIRKVTRQVRTTLGIRELNAMVPSLNDAYCAMSFEECSTLLRQWEQIVADNELLVTAHLAGQVEPIFVWVHSIEEQHRVQKGFADALAHLEHALAAGMPGHELRRAYTLAASFEQPIPDELQNHYDSALAEQALIRTRRNRSRFMAAGALTVVGAAAVFAAIHLKGIDTKCRSRAEYVQGLIQDGHLDRSREVIEVTEKDLPALTRCKPWEEARTTLAVAVAKDKQRREQFDADAKNLEEGLKRLDQRVAAGCSGQEDCVLLTVESKRQAAELEKKTTKLSADVKTRSEGKRAEGLNGQMNGIARRIGADFDALRKERLAPIETDVDQLERDVSNLEEELDDFRDRLKSIEKRFEGFEKTFNVPEPPMKKRLLVLRSNLKEAERKIRDKEKQVRAIARLPSLIDSPTDLAAALRKFVIDFPVAPEARDFELAAKYEDAWIAMDKWTALRSSQFPNVVPQELVDVGRRLEGVEAYLKSHPGSPLADAIQRYQEKLIHVRDLLKGDKTLMGKIDKILKRPYMKWSIITCCGNKQYYVPRDSNSTAGSFTAIVNLRGDTKRRIGKNVSEIIRSPQKDLAVDIHNLMGRGKKSEREVSVLEAAEMISKRTSVDAILREWLLKDFLTAGKPHLANVWADIDDKILKHLNEFKTDVNWVDPEDHGANQVRPQIEEFLVNMATKLRDLAERVRMSSRSVPVQCDPCGLLLRDMNGPEVRQRFDHLTANGSVRVVVKRPRSGKYVLREIGQVSDGAIQIDGAGVSQVPQGSLVYVCE